MVALLQLLWNPHRHTGKLLNLMELAVKISHFADFCKNEVLPRKH
jgi:hypothetical protein